MPTTLTKPTKATLAKKKSVKTLKDTNAIINKISKAINKGITEKYLKDLLNDSNN